MDQLTLCTGLKPKIGSSFLVEILVKDLMIFWGIDQFSNTKKNEPPKL